MSLGRVQQVEQAVALDVEDQVVLARLLVRDGAADVQPGGVQEHVHPPVPVADVGHDARDRAGIGQVGRVVVGLAARGAYRLDGDQGRVQPFAAGQFPLDQHRCRPGAARPRDGRRSSSSARPCRPRTGSGPGRPDPARVPGRSGGRCRRWPWPGPRRWPIRSPRPLRSPRTPSGGRGSFRRCRRRTGLPAGPPSSGGRRPGRFRPLQDRAGSPRSARRRARRSSWYPGSRPPWPGRPAARASTP